MVHFYFFYFMSTVRELSFVAGYLKERAKEDGDRSAREGKRHRLGMHDKVWMYPGINGKIGLESVEEGTICFFN